MIICADREHAKILVQNQLKQINYKKDVIKEIICNLKNKVITNKLLDIVNSGEETLIFLTDCDLYWILKELDKVNYKYSLDLPAIDLKKEFTLLEKSDFENVYINQVKVNLDTIVIHNVQQIDPGKEYGAFKVSYKEIAEAWEQGVVTYNFTTQRESTIHTFNKSRSFVKKPTIYRKNVEAIKEKMREKTFKPNFIHWNILANGNEQFEFRPYSNNNFLGDLIITKSENSYVNIIDGYHRSISIIELLSTDPDFDGYIGLKIWCMDVQEAMDFVAQEASGTPLTSEKKQISKEDVYNTIVTNINRKGNNKTNVLFNSIGELNEVKVGVKKVAAVTMAQSIGDWFLDVKATDIARLSKYFVEFYNYLFSLLEELDYEVMYTNNMYTIYNYIAYCLYKDSSWENRLENIIYNLSNRIILSEVQKNLKIRVNDDKIKFRNKLYNFTKQFIDKTYGVAVCN